MLGDGGATGAVGGAPPPDWGWLAALPLRSLRLQALGLEALPPQVAGLGRLTRLSLMCNRLEDLPAGAYLDKMQHVHLGANRVTCFPPALRRASELRSLYLANQVPEPASGLAASLQQRLTLEEQGECACVGGGGGGGHAHPR